MQYKICLLIFNVKVKLSLLKVGTFFRLFNRKTKKDAPKFR